MISEAKKKIVIENYFKSECDVNTSIKDAYTKGFELGLRKAPKGQEHKGHWIMRHYIDKNRQGFNMWYCSECYKEYSYDAETGVGITDAHYCPNCGADMRCDSSKDDYKNRVIGVDLNHAEETSTRRNSNEKTN